VCVSGAGGGDVVSWIGVWCDGLSGEGEGVGCSVLCKSPLILLLWNLVLDRLVVRGKLDRRRR